VLAVVVQAFEVGNSTDADNIYLSFYVPFY